MFTFTFPIGPMLKLSCTMEAILAPKILMNIQKTFRTQTVMISVEQVVVQKNSNKTSLQMTSTTDAESCK